MCLSLEVVSTSLSLSVDNLRGFVEQFLAGELEPYIKSEPVPEDNSGPVAVSLLSQLPSGPGPHWQCLCRWWWARTLMR